MLYCFNIVLFIFYKLYCILCMHVDYLSEINRLLQKTSTSTRRTSWQQQKESDQQNSYDISQLYTSWLSRWTPLTFLHPFSVHISVESFSLPSLSSGTQWIGRWPQSRAPGFECYLCSGEPWARPNLFTLHCSSSLSCYEWWTGYRQWWIFVN